jgi:predicted DNA-binding transcriptional regulator AlpA
MDHKLRIDWNRLNGDMASSEPAKPRDLLLSSLPPRGLSRIYAAAYIGVSPSKFDEMVADKRMPRAIRIDGRRVWDRLKIDEAFAALDDGGEDRPRSIWDEVT